MDTLEATNVVRDVQREYRESVSIARGILIGIAVSVVMWGMIVGAIVLITHLVR